MATGKRIAVSLVAMLAVGAAAAQEENSETIKIYAAAAVKTSLTAIAAEFENATGNRVDVVFDSAGATRQKFLADPDADLLITSPVQIAQAQEQGGLGDGTSRVLGSTVAGIAVPPGTPKPDVSNADNLRAALLAAQRIAFSDPARGATVGNHFMTVIEALGVKDQVLAKAVLAPNGIETMRLVLEDGVDIGITQTSEILQANRDALAGPFPKEFELATAYALWHRNELSPAVSDFVAVLRSPAARATLEEEGLVPPDAE